MSHCFSYIPTTVWRKYWNHNKNRRKTGNNPAPNQNQVTEESFYKVAPGNAVLSLACRPSWRRLMLYIGIRLDPARRLTSRYQGILVPSCAGRARYQSVVDPLVDINEFNLAYRRRSRVIRICWGNRRKKTEGIPSVNIMMTLGEGPTRYEKGAYAVLSIAMNGWQQKFTKSLFS